MLIGTAGHAAALIRGHVDRAERDDGEDVARDGQPCDSGDPAVQETGRRLVLGRARLLDPKDSAPTARPWVLGGFVRVDNDGSSRLRHPARHVGQHEWQEQQPEHPKSASRGQPTPGIRLHMTPLAVLRAIKSGDPIARDLLRRGVVQQRRGRRSARRAARDDDRLRRPAAQLAASARSRAAGRPDRAGQDRGAVSREP